MKIVLVGNYPDDRQESMLRYSAFLERELRNAGHEVRVIHPKPVARRLVSDKSRFGKWLGYIDKLLLFRMGFSNQIKGADIVHICDHSNSPYLHWIKNIPKMITCHDALAIRSALGHFPSNPTRNSGKLLQRWIHKSLRHADGIVYISGKTRLDFEQLLGIRVPSEVIPHTLNWPYSIASDAEVTSTLLRLGLEKHGYILHVGGNSWYKNRIGVLQMFASLRRDTSFRSFRLVMVGKPLTETMRAWCVENKLSDVLVLLTIDNAELRILYSGAFALLFPSMEEGFGWPILEAQACGCPVITSNRAPMSEIAGDGAMLVDPSDIGSIHEAVRACLDDRKLLVDAGLQNLERFSLRKVVSRYEAFYQTVLQSQESIDPYADTSA